MMAVPASGCWVRCGEYDRPRRYALPGQAVVNVGGRQQAKAAVVVLGVVPGEKDMAVDAGVLDRTPAGRESGLRSAPTRARLNPTYG